MVNINPKYEDVWFHIGFCHAKGYNKTEAIQAYEKAIEYNPNNYDAWYNLGNQYISTSDHFIDDEDDGDYLTAAKYYKKALEIKPDFSYAWNNLGFCYFSLKEYEKSSECHEKAVKYDPDNQNARVNWGNATYFLNDLEKAIKIYENAFNRDPNHATNRLTLLTSLESFRNRNKISNKNKGTWFSIGIDYMKLSRHKKAIECFK